MRRKHLALGIIFLLIGSFIVLVAVSQQKTVGQLVKEMNDARNKLHSTSNPKGAWTVYSDEFDVLEQMIDDLKDKLEDLYDIKIDSAGKWDNLLKAKKAIDESSGIKKALEAVETKREEVEDKWLDAYDAWQAYHNAVAAYNSHPHVSPSERLSVPGLDKYVATSIYTCHGPCDVPFETASLAQVLHQSYCSEKHGTSGTTGVTYWTCFGNTMCHRSEEHWRVCGGSCGEKFAPRRINRGQGNYDYVANSPHYVTCSESGCNKKYYTCEHSTCPDTPSYHPCGVHLTSVIGNHSLQSSCSSTDSNGNSCTVTSFYACDNHSHTYPAPPPPTTVACGGASYTGCSGAPSRTAHYVPSCSNCRNDYWTCSQWAYRHTETKPCKRSGCDASPTPCQNGPRACVRPGKPANWHWL